MNLSPPARIRRKPSLTPMIDVVFLLLVFFMLASRFGMDQVIAMPLASAGGTAESPAPKLVDVLPELTRLNGIDRPLEKVIAELRTLGATRAGIIVLRSRDEASIQRIVEVSEALRDAGFANLVLVK